MRKVRFLLIPILLACFLVSCAAGTKGKMVSTYELAGVSLKAAYNVAKPACDSNQIPADKCLQIKKIYNDARASYLLAGDTLIVVVETDDLVKKQATLQEYENLVVLYTKNTTDIVNLLVQLGVLKGGK